MSASSRNQFSQLPSWPATLCACNIILAICATILVTHALVLNAANEKCLQSLVEGQECTGIIPSCTLEKALIVAEGFLFFYSMYIGFNSIFWMFRSCCGLVRTHGLNEEEVDQSTLHMLIHGIGCILSTSSIVSLAALALHGHFLLPTIKNEIVDNYIHSGKFRNMDTLHNCLTIFDNIGWNLVSLFTLSVCVSGHISLIAYLYMKKSLHGKKSGNSGANSVPNIMFNDDFSLYQDENDSGRVRIPSSRNYPSSPITLKPFGLCPEEEKKTAG